MVKLFILLVLFTPYYKLVSQHAYKLSEAALIQHNKANIPIIDSEKKNEVKETLFTPLNNIEDKDLASDYQPFVNSLCRVKWQSNSTRKLSLSLEVIRDLKYGAGIGMIYRIGKKKCCKY